MSTNNRPYILMGWELSYYTGKARCYLRHKGVPLQEKGMNLLDFRKVKKHTSSVVMPAVITPDGDWLQDTAHIIDTLEARHPVRSMTPADPVQQFAARLLETWFDEAWIPPSMHYRWSYPENYAQFEREGGDELLPYMPRFLKNRAVAQSAKMLQDFLPGVGVVPDQIAQIEAATIASLDHLEAHFASHDWLLGDRPSMADFGLAGPIYGHLGRDPWPKQHLVGTRPHLAAWLQRVSHPISDDLPEWAAFLPASLDPVFATIAAEFIPRCVATADLVTAHAANPSAKAVLPRGLDEIATPLAGKPFRYRATSFLAWKIQRLQDGVKAMPDRDQQAVRAWADEKGLLPILDVQVPRLGRKGLRVLLSRSSEK